MTRILIADDNAQNLYLLRMLLQGHGFTVDEAGNGAEALAVARRLPPDIIVSDMLMPVVDGYMLLRHWRNDEALRSIPFMVYTATFTEPKDERLAMALGADAFVVKPAEPEALLARIEEVLAQKVRGGLPSLAKRPAEDQSLLQEYNEILVHKLEQKAAQLERVNCELLEEISERRRTESELRLSEERYRNLFNSILDPLFVHDRETLSYLAVNDAAIDRYGYSRDDFAHMTRKEICLPEDLPSMPGFAGGIDVDRAEIVRHRRRDGSVFEVEQSSHDIDFAGRPACLVQARDLTGIRRAEAEMAQTARLLQAVVEGTSDAVFVKDLTGKYLMFNAAASRLVGKPVEEVIGNDDFALFGAEEALTIMGNDRLVMESGEVQTVEEHLFAAGVQRIYHAIKAPYRDESGNVIGVVGVSRDISEHRKLEEQLRQSQKMEAVGRLAGGIAHDFNNLLTVIAGYSDMIISNPGVSQSDLEAILVIQQAGERAAALTRQLLGFSRQTILQPRVLNLNDVILDTGNMLRRLIGEDLEFTTVLAPNLSLVKVDPSQLDQVLMNLAVNARDAMPRGGALTLETANVLLDGDYAAMHPDCKPGPHVMLTMTDTGCGMTREVLSRIFEPFFTTKAVGMGTGLGLAMVFGIVQQSGGFIHVYSEVGRGTTFRIYLPAVDEPVPEIAAGGALPDLGGTETVLLVEDDAALCELALMSLKRYGYRVLSAYDGRNALQAAQEHTGPIHILLTDVVMPNMGGPELAQELRMRFPGIRVLFTSGYTDDAVVRHGLLEAHASFIQKPYTPQALGKKLREVLEGH